MIICNLKMFMDKHNMTQSKLADLTGISRPTIIQLIRNENQNIKYDNIDKICDTFDIGLNDLLVRSSVNIEFKGLEVLQRKEFVPPSNSFEEGYETEIFNVILSYIIDGRVYEFSDFLMIPDFNNYEIVLMLKCYIDKEEYENLFKKGFNNNFFEAYNYNLNIAEKITKKLPTKKDPNHTNISVEFIINNSPNFEYIKSIVNELPLNQIKELKKVINNKLVEAE